MALWLSGMIGILRIPSAKIQSRLLVQFAHVCAVLIKSSFQFPNDPDFPYVGKFVANLTLAQIKTLDCGSLRQDEFREFFSI